MAKFEIGDRVMLISTEGGGDHYAVGKIGWKGTVVSTTGISSIRDIEVRMDDSQKGLYYFSKDLALISDTSHTTIGGSIMSKLTVLAKKMFDKDTKTLIKAGVLNNDLEVANQQFVLSFLVDKHKAELAALAQEQLDEDEKKS